VTLSLGIKRLGCEVDHSSQSSAEVKICGAVPPFSQYVHGMVLSLTQGKLFTYLLPLPGQKGSESTTVSPIVIFKTTYLLVTQRNKTLPSFCIR
jgi:hypothetical protein